MPETSTISRSSRLSAGSSPKRRRRGSITLEAVMVFPLLLTILFVSIEFSWMFFVRHTMSNAAREGARAAIIPEATNADVAAAIDSAVRRGGLSSADYNFKMMSGNTGVANLGGVTGGSAVSVQVVSAVVAVQRLQQRVRRLGQRHHG